MVRYIHVAHTNSSAIDENFRVVAVFADGSLACSCGAFAEHRRPCKHMWAACQQQHLAVNLLLHCHPCYHTPETRHIAAEYRPSFTIAGARCPLEAKALVTATCSWNTAVQATKGSWDALVMGVDGGVVRYVPPASKRSVATLSRAEKAHAITLELRGYAKTDDELLKKLSTVLMDHRDKLNLRSLNLLEDKAGRKRSTADSLRARTSNAVTAVTAVTATKAPVKSAQQEIAQVALMAPVAVTKVQWVECEDCRKWRQVPAEHTAPLPDTWRCGEAEWARIACTDDEEAWPAEGDFGGEGAAGGANDFTIYGQTQPKRGKTGRHESMPSMMGAKRTGAGLSASKKKKGKR